MIRISNQELFETTKSFLIQPLLEAKAKKCTKFCWFLEDRRPWYFAFDFY